MQLVCGGLASAFLADALLTSGRRYSSSEFAWSQRKIGSYGSMVVFFNPPHPAELPSSAEPSAPIVRRLHESCMSGKLAKAFWRNHNLSRQCWCNEAHDRRDPTRASQFAATGPDAGVKRGTDKCETYARTHSAPHQNSSGAVI